MSSTDAVARGKLERPAPGLVEIALLGGLSLAWGTSYMFTKIAVQAVPPITLIAVRTLIASALMLVYLSAKGALPRLSRRDIAAFLLVGLLSNAAPLCLIAISVQHIDSSVTATTMALVPLLTVFYGMIGGVYPSVRSVFGVFVGLTGIVVLFGPEVFLTFGDSARGLAAAAGASLIFSASLFSVRLVRRHDSAAITTFSLMAAAFWAVIFALLVDGVPHMLPSVGITATVLVLAVWNTAAASFLMYATVSRAGPAFTSYNNYLVPVVAVVCGALILGEVLTSQSIVGVILVLSGVAISTVRRRVRPDAAPPA